MPGEENRNRTSKNPPTRRTVEKSTFRSQVYLSNQKITMCKTSIIHDACQTGARDGRNFPLENCRDEVIRIFARQYVDERARAAYCSNFLMEVGRRISPVNDVPMRRFVCA